MQQRGSKYDQKFKEEALALVASGVSITNAACRLRIPKSTLADWVHTQNEGDEDGIAARREIRRTQIKRCNKVVDDVVRSLGRKAAATLSEMKDLDEGLAIVQQGCEGRLYLVGSGSGRAARQDRDELHRHHSARAVRHAQGYDGTTGSA